jgi:hypothetical protein
MCVNSSVTKGARGALYVLGSGKGFRPPPIAYSVTFGLAGLPKQAITGAPREGSHYVGTKGTRHRTQIHKQPGAQLIYRR